MNERIKELMVEAGMLYTLSTPTHITKDGTHTFTELYVYDKFDPEKFAELIVRDCLKITEGLDQTTEEIKQHFGVEE